jgi:drug/metabolite transporter (DMT)-like permease
MLVECLVVATIFGLTPLLNKYILRSLSVEGLMIVSATFFGAFALAYGAFCCSDTLLVDYKTISRQPFLLVLVGLSAFLILVVANFLYLTVIRDHNTAVTTAITASYPLVTAIAGVLFLNEAITGPQAIGALLIVGGVFMLNQ